MRRRRIITTIVALAIVTSACGSNGSNDSSVNQKSAMGGSQSTSNETEEAGGTQDDGGQSSEPKVIKVGYLHTVAVDENLWVGKHQGIWKEHGIKFKPLQFNTGVSLAQALAGGSVDVGIMGSVLSNFPSRGQGVDFLANNIEAHSVKFYGSQGVSSIPDLKGKQVITTTGTAGEVVLYRALKANGMSLDDIKVVNADMPSAVNAYISGSVPALVTWLPFNVTINKQLPDAKPYASGDEFYDKDKGLLGGWVAANDFYKDHKDALEEIAKAWLEVNAFVINNPNKVVNILHDGPYSDVNRDEIKQMHNAAQLFDNDTWADMYKSGAVSQLIGMTEKDFVGIGVFDKFVDPSEFFDESIFLNAYKKSQTD